MVVAFVETVEIELPERCGVASDVVLDTGCGLEVRRACLVIGG
jgi:hypothetical protein